MYRGVMAWHLDKKKCIFGQIRVKYYSRLSNFPFSDPRRPTFPPIFPFFPFFSLFSWRYRQYRPGRYLASLIDPYPICSYNGWLGYCPHAKTHKSVKHLPITDSYIFPPALSTEIAHKAYKHIQRDNQTYGAYRLPVDTKPKLIMHGRFPTKEHMDYPNRLKY